MSDPDREPSFGLTLVVLLVSFALVTGLGSGLLLGITIATAKLAIHGP